jgi:predicted house-cleaning noncanonical NTP pyrophosphatase (MazG superfamily)
VGSEFEECLSLKFGARIPEWLQNESLETLAQLPESIVGLAIFSAGLRVSNSDVRIRDCHKRLRVRDLRESKATLGFVVEV